MHSDTDECFNYIPLNNKVVVTPVSVCFTLRRKKANNFEREKKKKFFFGLFYSFGWYYLMINLCESVSHRRRKKTRPILTKVCVYLKCNKVENIISAWDSIIFFSSSLHTNDKMKRKKRRKKDVWTKTIEFSVFAFFNSIYLLNKEKKPSPEMEENESKIVLSAKGLSSVVYAQFSLSLLSLFYAISVPTFYLVVTWMKMLNSEMMPRKAGVSMCRRHIRIFTQIVGNHVFKIQRANRNWIINFTD